MATEKNRDIGPYYWVSPRICQHSLWLPTRIILGIFCGFKFYGRKNLKKVSKTYGVVFAANHASELDPPAINAAFRFLSEYLPLFFASDEIKIFKSTKKFSWRARLYGSSWFFRVLGAYPVYTRQTDKSGGIDYARALRNQIKLLANGESLLFFPEGIRTRDGNLSKARPGIGYLLYHTNTTIVPVAITGTFNVTPKSFFSRKHKITVTFGEPIQKDNIPCFKNNIEPSVEDYRTVGNLIME
ncbi:MAG: 1-acyl-sn-glycerol-3-phosphate acyltransferase, partial [Parcubacteria group bacterium]|nr:1-acyl-sn-glycerol-3-phosphate acyltransferase [Parcubacteria group bacterium]